MLLIYGLCRLKSTQSIVSRSFTVRVPFLDSKNDIHQKKSPKVLGFRGYFFKCLFYYLLSGHPPEGESA